MGAPIRSGITLYEAYGFKAQRISERRRELLRRVDGERSAPGFRATYSSSQLRTMDLSEFEQERIGPPAIRLCEIGFEEFKKLVDLRRAIYGDASPFDVSHIAAGRVPEMLDEISELEEEISRTRTQMAIIESDIMEEYPRNSAEACRKLDFLSKLLVDAGDIDQDFLAYMISECVSIMVGQLNFADQARDLCKAVRRTADIAGGLSAE